ncbi:MAG: hypothetical protein FWD22_03760 [Treponema sp.]|nr:hypothetical protein [Treponema sp.]
MEYLTQDGKSITEHADGTITDSTGAQITEAEAHERKWGSIDNTFVVETEGGAMAAVQLIPLLIGKFVSSLFSSLFKMGSVAKLLQTLIIGISCSVLLLALFLLIGIISRGVLMPQFPLVLFFIVPLVVPALWFWLWHFDVIKLMGAVELTNMVKNSFTIAFYGIIVACIAAIFNAVVGIFVTLGVIAASIILYFSKVKPYDQEAARKRGSNAGRMMTFLIGSGIAVAITLAILIGGAIGKAIETGKEIDKIKTEYENVVVAAKNTGRQGVAAVVANTTPNIPVFSRPNEKVEVKKVNFGDAVTITGKIVVRGTKIFVPVLVDGVKGYIEIKYIMPARAALDIINTIIPEISDIFTQPNTSVIEEPISNDESDLYDDDFYSDEYVDE